MIRPEDDAFHQRTEDPYWNESGWFCLMIPERNLLGWVYCYHRPNMNLSAGSVALWDASGEHTYDCIHYEFDEHMPLPEDADMYSFTLDNSLTLETVELQRSYRMSYKGDGCEVALSWQALAEPHEVSPLEPGTVNPGVAPWASHHYEQVGRITGTVAIAGEPLQVDRLVFRDHSWGPRRPRRIFKRGGYSWGIASEASSFHGFALSDLSPDTDPVLGTTEQMIGGWYTKDGVIADLVSGTRRVERGDEGRPLRVMIDGKDRLGRELHVVGRCENWLKWHGNVMPTMFVWWCLTSWDLDGQQAWGEEQDYFMLSHHRRFMRSLLKG
jgi:hypothetical protein